MEIRKKRILSYGLTALVICVTLALAAIFGMRAGASEGEGADSGAEVSEPVIVSKNISYSSELYTCYAVPCDTVLAGESVWLEIMNERGEVKTVVTEYRTENVNGITCYTFKGAGTSARNIGKVEYVRAMTSDGGVSPTIEYSVLEYLCEKLCREGYLNYNEADGKEFTRRALYLQLLKYASSAQNVLGSSGIDLEEVCYVGALDTPKIGFASEGDAVSVSFDASLLPKYREFVCWEVYHYDLRGNLLDCYAAEDGFTVEASGFVTATPVYKTDVPEGVIAIYGDSDVTISLMGGDGVREAELAAAEAIKARLTRIINRGDIRIAFGELDGSADLNIIIGESDSAASGKAYERLTSVRSARMYSEARYAIAALGNEIAIAYDKNEYTDLHTVSFAPSSLFGELSAEGRMLAASEFCSDFEVNLIEAQRAEDALTEEAEWAELLAFATEKYGAEHGEKVVSAIKEYYSIRSDNLIVWYANLYDPGIGGFYAADSAKKYAGFMPLLETTGQLLGHLASYGVFSAKGNSSKSALPEHIRAQIIYYAKSCQDPESGYFYNPQLGKAETDKTVVRRGRDLSRVTSMLSSLGSKPTYNAPNGTKGDGITADEYWASTGLPESLKPYVPSSLEEYESYLESLTGSLGENTESAVAALVSRTVLLASTTSDSEAYLASHANFDAYLQSKDIDASPYSVGNELNGTYKLIQVASDKLGAYASADGTSESDKPWYEGMTLCDMLINWMTAHINEKGLFGSISEGSTDELEGIKYLNANGFFKMITIYNAWGVEYPKPMLAAKGLLTSIKGDEPSTGNVCNVYNSWNALSSLLTNVNKTYADPTFTAEEKAEIVAYIDDALGADGPSAITNSYNKQKNYLCSDGTFSNSASNSVANFPGGLPCGLGIKEGNVDAIGFGFSATMNSIYSVMGLSAAKVEYYREYHYLIFLEEILNVEPVTSKIGFTVNSKDFVNTWDNYSAEEYTRIASINVGGEGNSAEVITEGGNSFVKVTKIAGTTATTIGQQYTYKEADATKLVFGARIRIVELTKNAQIQFSIGGSSKSPFMALCKTGSTAEGASMNVNGYASNSKVGEWFTIRIEYWITERDAEGNPTGFKMETYINDDGDDAPVYTTTSFYGNDTKRQILELDDFDRLVVSFNQPNVGIFYIDDLYLHKINAAASAAEEA